MYSDQFSAVMSYLRDRDRLNRVYLLSEDTISDDMIAERKKLIWAINQYYAGINARLIQGTLYDYNELINNSQSGRERLATDSLIPNVYDNRKLYETTMKSVRATILEHKYL